MSSQVPEAEPPLKTEHKHFWSRCLNTFFSLWLVREMTLRFRKGCRRRFHVWQIMSYFIAWFVTYFIYWGKKAGNVTCVWVKPLWGPGGSHSESWAEQTEEQPAHGAQRDLSRSLWLAVCSPASLAYGKWRWGEQSQTRAEHPLCVFSQLSALLTNF